MIAFEKFKELNQLPDHEIQKKHREWLKDYEGKKYSIGEDGHHTKDFKWTETSYKDSLWKPAINMVGRLSNRLRIEFDDKDISKIPEHLRQVKQKLKEIGAGYIESTHNGKSNYLWIEFTKAIKDKEAKAFLEWIAPENSIIDLNFASSRKVFPCLFAIHWKHTQHREIPIDFVEGEQINFEKLNIPTTSAGRVVNKIIQDGFQYSTFNKASSVFSKQGQAEVFGKIQPLFYDRGGNFWLWNDYKWTRVDDTDILVMIAETTGEDTVSSKNKTEILNALKQHGRKNIPEDIKPTWIQFKDKIFDIETGEEFEATPKYFATNPIPYPLHKEKFENTPTLDKIFEEWVGKDYVQTLYEIIAYFLLPEYPLHRIFCFIGGGMNGKSKFLELLRRFVGMDNCCSTELDTLLNSRFEVTRLHRKLICQLGETNFNEMSKTSMLKKLSGGDLIGFEYKNKDPLEAHNYAKILIATNNLPATTDKTVGFYRRWLIIDFPNQFSEKKDILAEIPEEEYQCLALKCTRILKDLLRIKEFTNEGSIEQRMEKYESKSNFLEQFIKEFTHENPNGFITKASFYKKFTEWCKENRHREMSETSLGIQMKKLGIETGKKNLTWMNNGQGGYARAWLGIVFNE